MVVGYILELLWIIAQMFWWLPSLAGQGLQSLWQICATGPQFGYSAQEDGLRHNRPRRYAVLSKAEMRHLNSNLSGRAVTLQMGRSKVHASSPLSCLSCVALSAGLDTSLLLQNEYYADLGQSRICNIQSMHAEAHCECDWKLLCVQAT